MTYHSSAPATSTSTLPRQVTPFVGRASELTQIRQQLLNPACRLLTVFGPGGMGKTRLAIEVATSLQDEFAAGIHFVNLQPLSDPAQLPTALADALHFPLSGSDSVESQLFQYLANKEVLLLLDNFEHLLAGVDVLSGLLIQSPGVKVLITSREVLNLQEEWLFPLAGLAYPPLGFELENLEQYAAANLFVERIRRLRPQFVLAEEAAVIGRICRLVEGMPLALELAASWTKTLTCAEIATEIERNIEFLSTSLRNTPERHRSMLAVFEQSWQQLTPHEQEVLAGLSVFCGGFRHVAAEQVIGATRATLSSLVEKSLVHWERDSSGNGRYQLHELLRQFAADKQSVDQTKVQETRTRHSRYYLNFLGEQDDDLNSANQRQALDMISGEIENIRPAWAWAIHQCEVSVLNQHVDTLYDFYQTRSDFHTGERFFASSIALLHHASDEQAATQALLNRLLARQGAFQVWMGQYPQAKQILQPLADSDDPRERAFVLHKLGQIAWYQADKITTETYLRRSLAISQRIGDRIGEISTTLLLADQITNLGKMEEARQLAQDALALCHQVGRPDWLATAHHALAWSLSCTGHYGEAEVHWHQSLQLYQQIGDRLGIALATNYLGWVKWCQGGVYLDEAINYHQRALTLYREIGSHGLATMCLADLALASIDAGAYEKAQHYAEEGLTVTEANHSFDLMVFHLYCLGAAATGMGDFRQAIFHLRRALQLAWEFQHLPHLANTLYFCAIMLVEEAQLVDVATSRQKRQKASELLQAVLTYPATWQAIKDRARTRLATIDIQSIKLHTAIDTGTASTVEMSQIVNTLSVYLSEVIAPTVAPALVHGSERPQQPLIEPLTERELEILHLIAEGYTNLAIAEKLILSPGTVKWYSSEIYGKLGVANRTQAAAEARLLKLIA